MTLLRARFSSSLGWCVAQIGAGLVCALGAIALLGWGLNVDALRCIVPGSTPLKPNIALGFVLCGSALMLLAGKNVANIARIYGGIAGVGIATMGALTLGEHFFGWNLG